MASLLELHPSIFALLVNAILHPMIRKTTALVLLLLVVGCSGSKALFKKGEKLDEAGMYKEATEYYINALARKRGNIDAKIALKKSGQRVLDERLMEFYQAQAIDDHKRAVYSYLEAQAFSERVLMVGVELDIPSNYEDMFESSKKQYVSSLYSSASERLENENYEEASAKFEEIKRLLPEYKNVQELSRMAFQEPLYQEGLKLYNEGRYRDAWRVFHQINKEGDYKDSRNLEIICLENGRYTVGIVTLKNSGKQGGADEAIATAVAREILNGENPFLRLLDRSQTESILKEQYLNMSGAVEVTQANMAGELLGADALLTGEVLRADINNGGTERLTRRGFRAIPRQVKDPATGKKKTVYSYERVQYDEVIKQNQSVVSFQYRLISTRTGEVLAADVITIEKSDRTEYVDYSGDIRYLYPGTWGANISLDKVDRSYSQKNRLDQRAAARKEVRSAEALATDAYSEIANRVARALIDKIE